MGVNVVRLGYMWTGAMPSEGEFNQTYVDRVEAIVERLGERGIYTLLDMHEDVLSSKFCLYDGAPLWVVNKSKARHPFPWPLKGNCSSRGWMSNTLTEAAAQAYQDLYDNHAGMLDDLANFWSRSAERFRDNPWVIGYEIINEPFAGDFYADPLLLLPGEAGRKNLARMYETVAASIREHDDDHLIFYEPVTWGMLFEGKIVGSGFAHVPGGDAYRNRSCFSYHYYCASFVPGWEGKPVEQKLICDHVTGPLVFEAVKKDLAALGGAQMMTEGIACGDNKTECARVMGMLDDHLFSYTSYADSQGETFDPLPSMQAAWARTYARAIAGTPTSMHFDPETKDFDFCFRVDLSIAQPTEIFASATYSYPSGRNVTTTPNVLAREVGEDIIEIVPNKNCADGQTACLSVRRV